MLRIGRIVACVFLAATSAQAQELAGTFEQLRVLVKTGDTVTVTDTAGRPVRGKLVNLSSSSLSLNVSGTNREFQKADVNTIDEVMWITYLADPRRFCQTRAPTSRAYSSIFTITPAR